MNDKQLLGYPLLALLFLSAIGGIAWQRWTYRRKLQRWYGGATEAEHFKAARRN